MRSSDTIGELLKALVSCAPDLRSVQKNKAGFGYKYTTLDGIIEMLRDVLPKHGVWFYQSVSTIDDENFVLRTRVFNVSGEWIEDELCFGETAVKGANSTQQMGASITYFRRYALAAFFAIAADEDTDGVSVASQRSKAQSASSTQPQPKSQSETPQGASNQPKQKQDPLPFILAVMAEHLKFGETQESVLKSFADILQTDEIRSPEQMTDAQRSALARALYKQEKGQIGNIGNN